MMYGRRDVGPKHKEIIQILWIFLEPFMAQTSHIAEMENKAILCGVQHSESLGFLTLSII
jgi:hypothetical protein